MIAEISCLVLGIPVGYLLRRHTFVVRATDQVLTWSVRVLLLVLGLALGSDAELMSQMGSLGLKGGLIGFSGMAGSLIGARLLTPYLERRRAQSKTPGERGASDTGEGVKK